MPCSVADRPARQRHSSRRLFTAIAILLAACGGDSGPTGTGGGGGGGGGGSHLTATVAGESFAANDASLSQGVQAGAAGLFVIAGTDLSGTGSGRALNLALYNIRGPGTYPLGVAPSVPGGLGIVVDNGAGWDTPLSGAAGTVTITALTATRIAGTFEFSAEAVSGGATGTRSVTNGDFDLPVKSNGSLPVVPDAAGSQVSGMVDGQAWNAATVAPLLSGQTFVVTASNTEHTVSISIGDFNGPGSYALTSAPPLRTVTVSGPAASPQSSNCCWGGVAGGTGTIEITSASATRVRGSLNVTVSPQGGTAATDPITMTGDFDLGIAALP